MLAQQTMTSRCSLTCSGVHVFQPVTAALLVSQLTLSCYLRLVFTQWVDFCSDLGIYMLFNQRETVPVLIHTLVDFFLLFNGLDSASEQHSPLHDAAFTGCGTLLPQARYTGTFSFSLRRVMLTSV